MARCKRKPKKRQFFALLQSNSTIEQKAVLLNKKCSRAQAEAQLKSKDNHSWDILLIIPHNTHLNIIIGHEARRHYQSLEEKINAKRFITI